MSILPSLLLIASVAPAARASNSPGLAGGATRAAATALKSGVRYSDQLAPVQQTWYELEAGQAERVIVRLSGRTRSCPVRMTLIDAHGLALGEIASTTREIEPFIVFTPEDETSSDYYLRVQQDSPASRCASSAYVFALQEPEQAEESSCQGMTGDQGEPITCAEPSKESSVPAYEARACTTASRRYRRLESEYARERSSSARRRLGVEIRVARRAVIHGCRY